MKKIWSKLTPTEFEELCYVLLDAMGFTDIKWYGKLGSDKGRDLTAKKEESTLPSTKRMAKWVIQCKRYITKPPTKRDIQSFLEDAEEHNPDNVLIIITNTLSSNTKDWIETAKRNRKYRFDIDYWEELDLERVMPLYRAQISEHFPKIYSQATPVTVEKVIKKKQYVFSCSEWLNRIEIVALDKPSEEKAKEDVIEFIKFLRANRVVYDWEQTKKPRSRKRAS